MRRTSNLNDKEIETVFRVGRKVSDLRMSQGRSRLDVETAVRSGHGWLARVEMGEIPFVSLIMVHRLAVELGTTVDGLMTVTDR